MLRKDMKGLFIGIILIHSVTVFSQSYTLPAVLFDSLVFEVQKGRECTNVVRIQEAELANYALIENSLKTQLEALQEQIALREYIYTTNREALLRTHENRLKAQRRRTGKITAVAVVELVVIILLL